MRAPTTANAIRLAASVVILIKGNHNHSELMVLHAGSGDHRTANGALRTRGGSA